LAWQRPRDGETITTGQHSRLKANGTEGEGDLGKCAPDGSRAFGFPFPLAIETASPMNSSRKNWVLTQEAFDQLLACLDPNRDRAGTKYEALRQKLIKFFAWRGCATAEDYVDEAIDRV